MLLTRARTFIKRSCLTVNQAKQVHAHLLIAGHNTLEPLFLRQILLSAFKSSNPSIAHYVQLILYNTRNPDPFSWGYTIRFFSQKGQFIEAISLFVQMLKLGLRPTSYAISSTIKSCARLEYEIGGAAVHCQVHLWGLCGCVYIQTALLDFYAKMGDMDIAKKVFDEMVEKNVVSWNSILSGYLKVGNLVEAHKVFGEIPEKDVITWNSMVSGYAKAGNMDQADSFFKEMPQRNLASWNAMISGYVDCGRLESARNLFDIMPMKNNVSWMIIISGYSKNGIIGSARNLFDQKIEKDVISFNAMISCYVQNGKPEEALELFKLMLKPDLGLQPDKMTLSSVISACSHLGDLEYGYWVESYMSENGIAMDDHLATALVDLYAKCGSIDRAYELFRGLRKRDLVAYSAMIYGCGINGKAINAINLFKEMIDDNICPNLVTYTGLLTAYSHAGLVEEGYRCFNSMKDRGLMPTVEHYGIMVDLLGRAGLLDEAYQLIQHMPMQPHIGVWGALLLGCRLHNNVELGEIAARQCFKLKSNTTGYRSLLSSIYASFEKWDAVRKLRRSKEGNKFMKIPGCSWMQTDQLVHD